MLKNIGWVKDTDYLRIDGKIPGQKRQQIVEAFNSQADLSPRLMLVSIKAGSLGINLVVRGPITFHTTTTTPLFSVLWMDVAAQTCVAYADCTQGASRVVLLDAMWNPIPELQAVFRAYRFGQVRDCVLDRAEMRQLAGSTTNVSRV